MTLVKTWLIPAYLFLAIVLGGASNGGFFENAILQVLGALLLAWAFWNPMRTKLDPAARSLGWLLVIGLGLIVLQFLPLPGSLWSLSGGRAALVEEGATIGLTYSPRLWSLLPYETLKSAIWALPALTIGVAMLRLPYWRSQHIAWAIITAMVLSVSLGAVQLAGGNSSPAYFYEITNRGSTVGFFANSNHLATLLLVSVPFIAALSEGYRRNDDSEFSAAFPWIGLSLLLVTLVGIGVNGSLAGFGLVGPVLLGSVMIALPKSRMRLLGLVFLIVGLLIGLAWLFGTEGGQEFLASEDIRSAGQGGRGYIWPKTWEAIQDYAPWGAGLGSYYEVFLRYEDARGVTTAFINHAHNDYLELLLEFGPLILPVLAAFFFWWGRQFSRVWSSKAGSPYARAAAIASAAILLHEIVDYPLRTAAISCVFVACLCLMVRKSSPRTLLLKSSSEVRTTGLQRA